MGVGASNKQIEERLRRKMRRCADARRASTASLAQ